MFSGLKKSLINLKEKISTKEINVKKIEEELWEFKIRLIENNVAEEATDYIINEIKNNLYGKKVKIFKKIEDVIDETFKDLIIKMFENVNNFDIIKEIENKKEKPYIILFVGINGTGKTTSIAKIGYFLKKRNFKVVFACSDTFRAGAIEQIEKHAKNLGIDFIKHKYGASPTAVAYDAVQYAKKRNLDVVLIDTAGRMQTDVNLIDEMKKLYRVINPDCTLLVLDSLAGNDALKQAEMFNKELKITGYVLTKIDADEKGGIILSLLYTTKKPIVFIGNGTNYEDLLIGNKDWFINKIFTYE